MLKEKYHTIKREIFVENFLLIEGCSSIPNNGEKLDKVKRNRLTDALGKKKTCSILDISKSEHGYNLYGLITLIDRVSIVGFVLRIAVIPTP